MSEIIESSLHTALTQTLIYSNFMKVDEAFIYKENDFTWHVVLVLSTDFTCDTCNIRRIHTPYLICEHKNSKSHYHCHTNYYFYRFLKKVSKTYILKLYTCFHFYRSEVTQV